jgi:4-amino-4-deoxy-L-arabinose transferase-like glycosyltransferase
MKRILFTRKGLQIILFIPVLILTSFLTYFNFWKDGLGNLYYSTAIKSMMQSFHNFFFVAFDPGGFVSVDKPPVALWIQTIFALIFGFHGWSILLPEAMAAVLSVALIYHLIKRTFGFQAGFIAALALACTPIFIAVSRTNNLDSILILDLLISSWLLIKAAESSNIFYLIAAMTMASIGFNIKMFEAYLVIPAFYITYFLAQNRNHKKRMLQLGIGTAVLLAISFSWVLTVDGIPKQDRPYVGSSKTDSEMELAFGYNGIDRVFSGLTFPSAKSAISKLTKQTATIQIGAASNHGNPSLVNKSVPPPGFFRLLDGSLSGQISWFIPLSVFGMAAFYIWMRKNKTIVSRRMLINAVFWTSWISVQLVFFSFANITHKYYLSVLAPGLAAFTGIGLVYLWKLYVGKGKSAFLLPLTLIAASLVQFYLIFSYHPSWNGWLAPAVAIVCTACAVILTITKLHKFKRNLAITCFIIAASALFVAPAIWSATPLIYGTNMGDPQAGPQFGNLRNVNASVKIPSPLKTACTTVNSSRNIRLKPAQNYANVKVQSSNDYLDALTSFLVKNKGKGKYIVAVTKSVYAENMILNTGMPVMVIGGYTGDDPILTVSGFEKLVNTGNVRYFLLEAAKKPAGTLKIVKWVESHGKTVPQSDIMGIHAENSNLKEPGNNQYILYDLRSSKNIKAFPKLA